MFYPTQEPHSNPVSVSNHACEKYSVGGTVGTDDPLSQDEGMGWAGVPCPYPEVLCKFGLGVCEMYKQIGLRKKNAQKLLEVDIIMMNVYLKIIE